MAIAFSCACGKPMKARDEFAGRKMRCSACKKIVTIPESLSPPESPAAELEEEVVALAVESIPPETPPVPAAPLPFFADEDDAEAPAPATVDLGAEGDEEEEDAEEDEAAGEEDVSPPGPQNVHPWQDRSLDQLWTVG